MAIGCIFLACKIEENHKHLRDVIKVATMVRYEHASASSKSNTPTLPEEEVRDNALLVERSLLYLTGFNFNAVHPHNLISRELEAIGVLPPGSTTQPHKIDQQHRFLIQVAWDLCSDALKGLLTLQYPPKKITHAALHLAGRVAHVEMPSKWFVERGTGVEEVRDICTQRLACYSPGEGVEGAADP